MNEPDTSLPTDVPRPKRGPRRHRVWILFGIAAVLVFAAWQGCRSLSATRASTDRTIAQATLRGVAQAVSSYQQQYHERPSSLALLVQHGDLSPKQVRDVLAVGYRQTVRSRFPRLLAVQKEPCRAVKKGEPWGGPGEVAKRDWPAVRYCLFDDLRIEAVPEDQFEDEYAPLLKLFPVE
jgi:hypothetical protein